MTTRRRRRRGSRAGRGDAQGNLIDVGQITRYAVRAGAVDARPSLGFPDVIVAIDDESADSPVLAARVEALRDHRLRKIALLTIGGGIATAQA